MVNEPEPWMLAVSELRQALDAAHWVSSLFE
jgi:hypothetical protein